MQETATYQKEQSSQVPKIARDTALAIAMMSLTLATISLAIQSLLDTKHQINFFKQPVDLSIVFLTIGIILVITAALVIDWVIDNFEDDDWAKVLPEYKHHKKFDQIPARLRLFNSGYFFMCLCIAGLSFAILSLPQSKVVHANPEFLVFLGYMRWLLSGWVIFQMMTYKSGKKVIAFAIFFMVLDLIIGSVFF